jgi:transcription factor C subunit 7
MLASTMQRHFPEVEDTWAPVWFPSRNGENIEQIHNRMSGFMEAFLPEVERRLPAEKHARILLISHAAPIIGIVRHLLRDREHPFRPGCCSLTEIDQKKDGGWEAKTLGGGTHLTEVLSDWRQWGFENLGAGYGKVSRRSHSTSKIPFILRFYVQDHPNMSEIIVDKTSGSQLQVRAV